MPTSNQSQTSTRFRRVPFEIIDKSNIQLIETSLVQYFTVYQFLFQNTFFFHM